MHKCVFRWAKDLGAEGWSYAEVLPYFIKSEGHDNPDLSDSGEIYKIETY